MVIVVLASIWFNPQRGALHVKLLADLEAILEGMPIKAAEPSKPLTSGIFTKTASDAVLPAKHGVPNFDGGNAAQDTDDAQIRFVTMLDKADAVIAEISVGSIELGMQIAQAVLYGKRVPCLRRTSPGLALTDPFVLTRNRSITVRPYEEGNRDGLRKVVEEFLTGLDATRAARSA